MINLKASYDTESLAPRPEWSSFSDIANTEIFYYAGIC